MRFLDTIRAREGFCCPLRAVWLTDNKTFMHNARMDYSEPEKLTEAYEMLAELSSVNALCSGMQIRVRTGKI